MATSGGLRPGRDPGFGGLELVVLGAMALVALTTTGTVVATETNIQQPWLLLAALGGGTVLATGVLVTTARIGVPLVVRCCRGFARAYRAVRPNSPTVRRMLLALSVFLVIGGLFLGVGLFAV